MMVRFSRLFITLFLSLMALPVQAGDNDWTILEVIEFSTLTQQSEWLDYDLSPDGATFAWIDDQTGWNLCLFTITTKETICRPMPRSLELRTWSPNSQYVLLLEYDSESASFWIYDRTTGRFTLIEHDTDPWLTPLWHPSGSELYIARRERQGDRNKFLFYLYSLATGERTRLNVTATFPVAYDRQTLLTISPDGSQIIIRSSDPSLIESTEGLWVVDLSEQRVEQLATLEDLLIGLPDWFETSDDYSIRLGSVAWNIGANELLVSVISGIPQYHTLTVTGINLETREFSPLRDYRYLTEPINESRDQLYLYGFGGDITPDGELFIYYEYNENAYTIYALPLLSNARDPFIVSPNHDIPCGPPRFLVITAQHDGEIRRYNPRISFLCPG